MTTSTDQVRARFPFGIADVTVKNTHASINLVAGDVVTLDGSNLLGTAQPVWGVVQATTDDVPFGVAVEAIPFGGTGRVQIGGIISCIASAAITAKAAVECSTNGKVVTAAGAKWQLGIALETPGADTQPVYVQICIARNA